MNFRNFIRSYRGQQSVSLIFGAVALALCAVVLVQAWGQARQSATVVLVPPTLKDAVTLDVYESSPNYKTAWGLFFAQLVGNVTPAKVPFVRDTLEQFVAPGIFHDVIQRLEVEAAEIQREQIAITFEAQRVQFDSGRNLVIVEGVSTVKPAIGKEKRGPRTYEFEVEIINYRPVLRSMTTYEGAMKLPEVTR